MNTRIPGARRNNRFSPPFPKPSPPAPLAPTHRPSAAAGKRPLTASSSPWAEAAIGLGRLREEREGARRGRKEPTTPHRPSPRRTRPNPVGNLLPAAAAASPRGAAPRAAPCMGSARCDCPRERRRGRGAQRERGTEEETQRVREPSGEGRRGCGGSRPSPALRSDRTRRRGRCCCCCTSESRLTTTAAARAGPRGAGRGQRTPARSCACAARRGWQGRPRAKRSHGEGQWRRWGGQGTGRLRGAERRAAGPPGSVRPGLRFLGCPGENKSGGRSAEGLRRG